MKNLSRNTGILFIIALAVIVSCTEICDEPPIDDLNALYLQFKTEGENSFTDEELESFYLVRYFDVPGDSLNFPDDTLHYYGNFYNGSENRVRISNGTPFENDSLFYVRYNYGMLFESDTVPSILITDIELEGTYVGECGYENRKKAFRINDQYVDLSGSTDYYEITK